MCHDDRELVKMLSELMSDSSILYAEVLDTQPELLMYVVGKDLSNKTYDIPANALLHYQDHTGTSGVYVLFSPEQADQAIPSWREKKRIIWVFDQHYCIRDRDGNDVE